METFSQRDEARSDRLPRRLHTEAFLAKIVRSEALGADIS